jgi:hypothetical protein
VSFYPARFTGVCVASVVSAEDVRAARNVDWSGESVPLPRTCNRRCSPETPIRQPDVEIMWLSAKGMKTLVSSGFVRKFCGNASSSSSSWTNVDV